ncbi:hypothetical protein ACRAWD_23945 [Caulobacter segnis]
MFALLLVGAFLPPLDFFIVNVALPSIQRTWAPRPRPGPARHFLLRRALCGDSPTTGGGLATSTVAAACSSSG